MLNYSVNLIVHKLEEIDKFFLNSNINIMKKSLFIAGFIMIALSFVFIFGAKGKISSYYNGDALYYNGAVYLATANSGMAELFKIDNNKITEISQIRINTKNLDSDGFIDAVLNVEQRGLFLFLTDGEYVYKYDINNPAEPKLFKKSNNQSGGKFIGLGKMDNKVYSVSDKGVKIWDDDMQVFYNASLTNSYPHNLKLSKKGSFIFNINNDKLEIYDAYSQKLVSLFDIKVNDSHERNIFNDETNGTIYLVDDQAVKQFDFTGNLIKSFKHTSRQGYDVAYTPEDDHLYFSDGIGIVKLRKSDLKPIGWIYTKDFSGVGGWATGLKVVRDNYGEKIIVFNGSNITILNQDFKKVGSIKMPSDTVTYTIEENLALSLDRYRAASGSEIIISGQGFSPNENLSIYLANGKIDSTRAGDNGRFSKILIIPTIKPGKMDIRVVGEDSDRNYSVGFQIE